MTAPDPRKLSPFARDEAIARMRADLLAQRRGHRKMKGIAGTPTHGKHARPIPFKGKRSR